MLDWILNLQLFADGGAGAGAAGGGDGDGAAASAETSTEIREGMTLEDGTKVDRRLAERMEKQRRRNPELYRTAAQPTGGEQEPKAQEADPEQDWESLKKGKYAEQYGRDVQAAIADRFKNQANLQQQLDGLKPMLDALAQQRAIAAGD